MMPASKEAETETIIAGMFGAEFTPDIIPSALVWMISFAFHKNHEADTIIISILQMRKQG